jgi:TatD DNase family protein
MTNIASLAKNVVHGPAACGRVHAAEGRGIAMKLFDSHCHLDDDVFDLDFQAVVSRMKNAGVLGAVVVGVNEESSRKAVRRAESCPGLLASVGVHPHDAKSCSDAVVDRLQRMAAHPRVKAWGEIGLDFNRMFSPKTDQEKWMTVQLETARSLGLPVVFHERDSGGRFLELLRAHTPGGISGVVHCFSGSLSELEAYLDLGLHIGITGILTVWGRGAALRELAVRIPLERLLVETDAPYLTPVPERNRHRRNEPAFVRSVLLRLAEVRQEDPEMLAEAVWNNTCGLFGVTETEVTE